MDLTLFFSPIDESITKDKSGSGSFFKSISLYGDKIPDYRSADIAIIGVPEERGTDNNQGAAGGPDAIRSKLYSLKKGTGAYRIVDLGNLKPGLDLEETYTRLSEVCRLLLESNTLPIILGGTHDLDIGQYLAYQDLDKLVSFLNVDAFLDLEEGYANPLNKQHINRVLMHTPNYLFSYTHLAHQSYLVDPGLNAILEKLYFEAYRVGAVRSNIQEMEPAVRSADLLSFDLTAIKSADAPGNRNAQPFGLTGEEACQLCWYAGINEKLSSFGIYEYNPGADDEAMKTASVAATMIWYFIEGFYHRKNEQDFKSNDFLRYTVSMPVEPEVMTFYKSKITDRWWMEVPGPVRSSVVPCTYSDYEIATKGELPERYISTLSRMI
ncbi:MAG: formimidoylglutamase [Bacteroidetes bacterium]|nr:formimidoylglutamase [Bacteroidota bacterium]